MPKRLNHLTTAELFSILDCANLHQLQLLFSADDINNFFNDVPPYPHYISQRPSISRAILAILVDAPSLASMLLWSTVGSITLFTASLAILSASTLGALVVAGIFYSWATYKELQEKQRKDDAFFQLHTLKLSCANLLALKLQPHAPLLFKQPALHHHASTKRRVHIKQSVGMQLLVATTLFGTYYIGTSAVLAAFGFTTAFAVLTGPIGLGIALGISVAISIYFGVKHYQQLRLKEKVKHVKQNILAEVSFKHRICHELHLLSNLKAAPDRESPRKIVKSQSASYIDVPGNNKLFSPKENTPSYGTFDRRHRL